MRRLLIAVSCLGTASCTLFTLNDLDAIRKTRDAGGSPQLVADRTDLDFGLVLSGATSAAALVRISNVGAAPSGPLTVDITGPGAAQFAVTGAMGCDGLAPGATCDLSFTFAPAGAAAASATAALSSSSGNALSVRLVGEGVVPGALTLAPASADFGSVATGGQSATFTFTVTNTGNTTSGALDVSIVGTDTLQFEISDDQCATKQLAAAERCTVTARFLPGLAGARRATLKVVGAPGGIAVAALIGTGFTAGQLAISPSSRTLATLPAGSQGSAVTFQVTNNSTTVAAGMVALALTGGNAQDFEIVSTDCGATLDVTTSCRVQLRFTPLTAGQKVATLTATATPGGTASASLTATALDAAALTATPPSLDFGTVLTTSPAMGSVRLSNPGAVTTGPVTTTLSGGDSAEFSILSDCSAALAPNATCDLSLRFAPLDGGMRSTSLVVSAIPGGAVTVPLSGLGATPGAITLVPAMYAFGSVAQGSTATPRTFTATNNGGTPTSPLTVALGGTNANQFQTSMDMCDGKVLQPLASCDVTVNFAPTSGGSKGASLTVNATAGGIAVSTLNGAGQSLASLSIGPMMATFGALVGGNTGGVTQLLTVRNVGDLPTSALVTSITGADAASFTITSNTCAGFPLATGSCDVVVRFTPGSGVTGLQSAALEVHPVSGAGGTVTSMLSGTALAPSALSFDMPSFGNTLLNSSVDVVFVLTNSGGGTSGLITLAISGGNAGDFQILPALSSSDCVSGATTLMGGASCTVNVRWTARGRGPRSSTLSGTASPGGMAAATLSGYGEQQATLSAVTPGLDFGDVEQGVASTLMWTFQNSGDRTSGAVALSSTSAEFVATGCGGALDAGASCTASVRFIPAAAGLRPTTLQASASPGGTMQIGAQGNGRARITVVKGAAGTVTSVPAGISCGATCTGLFNAGLVTLTAHTTNGSNVFFSGWVDAGCPLPGRDCPMLATSSRTVGATFSPITNNLVFVTSGKQANNLGLAAYDTVCNAYASDAGINSATNNAFISFRSSTTQHARQRLDAGIHGFVRMDGRPVFDQTIDTIQPTFRIYNSIDFDEHGNRVPLSLVATGAYFDGSPAAPGDNCNNWTNNTAAFSAGTGWARGGPGVWMNDFYDNCDDPLPAYCFMNTKTAALTVPAATGRRIWLTNVPHLISPTLSPDAHCLADRPVGVFSAKALIATTTTPASTWLDGGTTYVRPDGQLVGTRDDLIAASDLITGVWVTGNGSYVAGDVWTGFGDNSIRFLTDLAVPGTTCSDWTKTDGGILARNGRGWLDIPQWWAVDTPSCGDPNQRLMCVEQ